MVRRVWSLCLFLCCAGALTQIHSDQAAVPAMQSDYYSPTQSDTFLYGEYLYWAPAMQDSLAFAQNDEDVFILKDRWSSGFRVGAGYRFHENQFSRNERPWQIEGIYTYYRSTSQLSSSDGPFSNLIPTYTGSGGALGPHPFRVETFTDYDSVHSSAVLTYNRADLITSWPMWVSNNLITRFLMGGVGIWMKDKWTTTLDATSFVDHINLNWDFNGGGLLCGLDAYLDVARGFGFFAKATLAALYGKMHTHEKYWVPGLGDFHQAYREFHAFKPVFNGEIGMDYRHWFGHSCMLHLAAGYELTWLFNMNLFGRRELAETNADSNFFTRSPIGMGLQGLSVRAGVDF